MEQDFEFAIHQLVEIAVRTLSPGINDPFTAVSCVDNLGSVYARIAGRNMPANTYADDTRTIRVVLPTITFEDVFDAGITQLRQYARGDCAVSIRLLEMFIQLLPHLHEESQLQVVHTQASAVASAAIDAAFEPLDKTDIEKRLKRFAQAFEASKQVC